MGAIRKIVIHVTLSRWGNVNEIRKWHLRRGWSDIGYHFVVLNGHVGPGAYFDALDGSIECGRPLDSDLVLEDAEIGAHVLGMNDEAVGICMVGRGPEDFTIQGMDGLKRLCLDMLRLFGLKADDVIGHYETPSGKAQGKTCPNFDVAALRTYLKGRA